MPIRFHLDEHIDSAIADGLRRRGIDVTTTVEAKLRTDEDDAHLAFARTEARVIVTHDADYLRMHQRGIAHAGIAYGFRIVVSPQLSPPGSDRLLLHSASVRVALSFYPAVDPVSQPTCRFPSPGSMVCLELTAFTFYRCQMS